MKILITGASGFIGKHILNLLSQEKYQLLLLAEDEKNRRLLGGYNAEIIISNLNNIQSCKEEIRRFDPQVCIHLAWEAIPDYSFETSRRNLDNSLDLINLIVNETGCGKLIISGSCYEYGKTIGLCRESNKTGVNSFFSWAKCALYNYCQCLCKKSNTDLVWFRIFYVYGPGQRKDSLIPTLVNSLKNGMLPQIKRPLDANDFIYVGDVARAFATAANKKIKPGIYNLGTGKATKVIDICRTAEKIICGTTSLSDAIKLDCNSGKPVCFRADTNKTRRALSWQPDVSIENGIKNYLKHEAVLL